MKNLTTFYKLLGLFCLLVGLSAFVVYPSLPAQIPTHWGISGQVDDYSDKIMIFALSFLPLLMMLIFVIAPKIDPKKQAYEIHGKAYRTVTLVMVLFLSLVYAITTAVALGYDLPVDTLVKLGIAVVFIVLGNVLKQVRHNYFFGIRTPWTLASEEVWRRTHRLGSYAFILAGLFAFVSVFLKGALSFYIMIIPILFISLGVTLYSLIIFKQLQK